MSNLNQKVMNLNEKYSDTIKQISQESTKRQEGLLSFAHKVLTCMNQQAADRVEQFVANAQSAKPAAKNFKRKQPSPPPHDEKEEKDEKQVPLKSKSSKKIQAPKKKAKTKGKAAGVARAKVGTKPVKNNLPERDQLEFLFLKAFIRGVHQERDDKNNKWNQYFVFLPLFLDEEEDEEPDERKYVLMVYSVQLLHWMKTENSLLPTKQQIPITLAKVVQFLSSLRDENVSEVSAEVYELAHTFAPNPRTTLKDSVKVKKRAKNGATQILVQALKDYVPIEPSIVLKLLERYPSLQGKVSSSSSSYRFWLRPLDEHNVNVLEAQDMAWALFWKDFGTFLNPTLNELDSNKLLTFGWQQISENLESSESSEIAEDEEKKEEVQEDAPEAAPEAETEAETEAVPETETEKPEEPSEESAEVTTAKKKRKKRKRIAC